VIYKCNGLGDSLVDLRSLQATRLSNLSTPAFQWDIKYLPVVVGFFGVLGVTIYMKRRKKRGKK